MVAWITPSLGCNARVSPILSACLPSVITSLSVVIHGGDVFDLSSKVIAPQGRLLVIGFASGRIPSLAANRALLKNMSLVGAFWGRYCDEHPGYMQSRQRARIVLYMYGKIDPPVGASYPMDQAPQGIRETIRWKEWFETRVCSL